MTSGIDPDANLAVIDSAMAEAAASGAAMVFLPEMSLLLDRDRLTRMVAQIETQVGSQLQSIRINGTLLGGLIGLALWGLSLLAATWQAAAAALPQLIAR